MNFFKFLFLASVLLAMVLISCWDPDAYCDHIEIINNSDYNITWVKIINLDTSYANSYKENSEFRDDELIAKNGGSKSFVPSEYLSGYTVCIKAEDTSEFMCTELEMECNWDTNVTKTLIWNGSGDSVWQPQQHLINAGYPTIASLKEQDPQEIYFNDCKFQNMQVDKCALYQYRLAVEYANGTITDPEKLKWWNWKDK